LQIEHHLEQGRLSEAPLRPQLGDQLLERQVLVGVGAERHLAIAAEPLEEGERGGELGAQGEGVDEEPDQPLGLEPVAIGDR
jgi:hypothetical protein